MEFKSDEFARCAGCQMGQGGTCACRDEGEPLRMRDVPGLLLGGFCDALVEGLYWLGERLEEADAFERTVLVVLLLAGLFGAIWSGLSAVVAVADWIGGGL